MTNSSVSVQLTRGRHPRRLAAAGIAAAGLLALTALAGCASSRGDQWAQLSPTIRTEGNGVVDLSAWPAETDRD